MAMHLTSSVDQTWQCQAVMTRRSTQQHLDAVGCWVLLPLSLLLLSAAVAAAKVHYCTAHSKDGTDLGFRDHRPE